MSDTITRIRGGEIPPPRVRSGYDHGYRHSDPVGRGANTAAARAETVLNQGGWLGDMSTSVLDDPTTMPVFVASPPPEQGKTRRNGDRAGLSASSAFCALREIAKYRPGTKVEQGSIKVACPTKIFSQQIREVDLYAGNQLAGAVIQRIVQNIVSRLSGILENFAHRWPQLELAAIPADGGLLKIIGDLPGRIWDNGHPPTLFTGDEAWKMLYAGALSYSKFPIYGESVFGVNLRRSALLPGRMVIGSGNLEDGLAAACSPIEHKRKGNEVVFTAKYAWAVTAPEWFRRYEMTADEDAAL